MHIIDWFAFRKRVRRRNLIQSKPGDYLNEVLGVGREAVELDRHPMESLILWLKFEYLWFPSRNLGRKYSSAPFNYSAGVRYQLPTASSIRVFVLYYLQPAWDIRRSTGRKCWEKLPPSNEDWLMVILYSSLGAAL